MHFGLRYKRLEKERFAWPQALEGATHAISLQELQWLLEGFDLWRNKPHASLHYEAVA